MRHTTRLTYEQIPNVVGSTHILCVIPGRSGPVFWPAYAATASADDWSHAVDWDQGIEMLRENGLTIGVDDRGFAHIRYLSEATREEAAWARRELKKRDREALGWLG